MLGNRRHLKSFMGNVGWIFFTFDDESPDLMIDESPDLMMDHLPIFPKMVGIDAINLNQVSDFFLSWEKKISIQILGRFRLGYTDTPSIARAFGE